MKPYYTIKIEKVYEIKVDKNERHYGLGEMERVRQQSEMVFMDDLTPEEAMEFMGWVIQRRKHGK